MDEVIGQAERLIDMMKRKEREIDNPALWISTINALEFLIENIE